MNKFVIGFLALCAAATGLGLTAQAQEKRPNIVILMTDDGFVTLSGSIAMNP
jgi:hypothetical protein